MRTTTVVIGAGPTGLSAAYHLGASSLLVEIRGSLQGDEARGKLLEHVEDGASQPTRLQRVG